MKLLVYSFAFMALLASCSSTKNSAKTSGKSASEAAAKFEPSRLYATPWRIVKLEAKDKTIEVPSNVEATIVFDQKESRVHGRCCNSYFGSYTLNGNQVSFDKMGSTKMLCHGIINDIEMLYHKMLSASPLTVKIDGQTMTLTSSEGTITYKAFNLE